MNVFVYIDALPFGAISHKYTPFLQQMLDQGFNYPLQNIMGYSFAIQSTILTGELPFRTKHWMPYLYSPYSNILGFRVLAPLARRANIDAARSRLLRTARYGMTSRVLLRRGAQTSSIPLSQADRFYIYPYYYMNELPSFKELETTISKINGSQLLYFGPSLQRKEATRHANEYIKSRSTQAQTHLEKTLLLLYVDSLDHRGHGYGVGSPTWVSELSKIDKDLEDFHATLKKVVEDFSFSIFSDHGMCNIEHTIDILAPLKSIGLNWKDITLFVDATIVNIWLGENTNRRNLRRAIERLSQNRFIVLDREGDAALLRKVGAPLDNSCIGDLIIQAKPGYMFYPNFYSDIKSFKGSHGYFPAEDCQQSFINVNLNAEKELSVFPSHIKDVRKLLISLVKKDSK